MEVSIQDLPTQGKVLEDSILPQALKFTEDFAFSESISARVILSKSGRQITAKGEVRTVLRLTCHRCLTEYAQPIEARFEHYFLPRPERVVYQQMLELEDADLGLSYYDGLRIDLGPSIHDAVLLEVPMKQTCRVDCAGLCASCGESNQDCHCERSVDGGPISPFAEFFRDQGMI